ncbi:putative lipoate-protein ligase A [Erysiphe neolycopersici]|uniref:Putative lipoate-protein ligase A n=1 Tax=Erysiphe neolycopersici TaxID=212602 RepID=A0A420HVZ6_9PEZI|nr:putative lipoate-protein ligase A [Erysiphe neolycopersici]
MGQLHLKRIKGKNKVPTLMKSLFMVSSLRTLPHFLPRCISRCQKRRKTTFSQAIDNFANKNQIYVSTSLDPYLNLSIEHHLFEKTARDSVILFIYTNRSSIIIGRNQNPWNEINLNLVRKSSPSIQIVRRRSGGGTVFHDEGNVNYCVISPASSFDRDKHAYMVVQALKSAGVEKVGINDRHDIVLEHIDNDGFDKPFKISGSAYKLTKFRSLHHGTCLLSSPNLGAISQYLNSPAKIFITARGVASVSSRIKNVCISNITFQKAVIKQFCQIYSAAHPIFVGDEMKEESNIAKGYAELKSNNWIYCQTPQFTFSLDGNSRFPTDPEKTFRDVWKSPLSFHEEFTARNGCITSASSSLTYFLNKNIHEIQDWSFPSYLESQDSTNAYRAKLGRFLNSLFGKSGD